MERRFRCNNKCRFLFYVNHFKKNIPKFKTGKKAYLNEE